MGGPDQKQIAEVPDAKPNSISTLIGKIKKDTGHIVPHVDGRVTRYKGG